MDVRNYVYYFLKEFRMKKSWKESAGLWTVVIVVAVTGIVIAQNKIKPVNVSIQPLIIIEAPVIEAPEIDPKIALLSRYIKTRKSSTPVELCDIIATEIITQSKANNIADDIIVGIIEIESMWNVYARSKAGARGLMQILLEDGVEIIPEKAYGVSYNIEKGIAIFKSKLKKSKGDVTLALKYYVGGDPEYHKAVYKYLGKYTLFKINHSKVEVLKQIKIN